MTVKVYDVRGRQVRTLVNEVRPAGKHQVTWNGDDVEDRLTRREEVERSAVGEMLAILKKEGSTKNYAHRLASLQEYEALVRLPEFLEMEQRYSA